MFYLIFSSQHYRFCQNAATSSKRDSNLKLKVTFAKAIHMLVLDRMPSLAYPDLT